VRRQDNRQTMATTADGARAPARHPYGTLPYWLNNVLRSNGVDAKHVVLGAAIDQQCARGHQAGHVRQLAPSGQVRHNLRPARITAHEGLLMQARGVPADHGAVDAFVERRGKGGSLLSSESNYTMALGLTQYAVGHNGTCYNLQMAVAVVMITSVIVLFFFAQRYFMRGIVTTGLAAH
jgi:hypothetical protein